jgi:hypothetical protein
LDGYTYHATEENCRFYDDLKKRIAITESNDIISWTLTWSDIEKFDAIEKENDNQSKEFKRDSLFIDQSKFRQTINTYKAIPYWGLYKGELIDTKNSFERLLWVLLHPTTENNRNSKIALMLSLRQTQFGVPSVDEDIIEEIISDPLRIIDNTLIATNKPEGKFYVFPELNSNADFAKTRVAIKLADLNINSALIVSATITSLDKLEWENFWQLYNLIQESLV